jgi:hypothetical protein
MKPSFNAVVDQVDDGEWTDAQNRRDVHYNTSFASCRMGLQVWEQVECQVQGPVNIGKQFIVGFRRDSSVCIALTSRDRYKPTLLTRQSNSGKSVVTVRMKSRIEDMSKVAKRR